MSQDLSKSDFISNESKMMVDWIPYYSVHRNAIARSYNLNEVVLESWKHLSLVRTTCAHHSRLWNREFTITPVLLRDPKIRKLIQLVPNSRKLYNTLVISIFFADKIAPSYSWRSRLGELIAKYSILVDAMGFPQNWQHQAIWQAATSWVFPVWTIKDSGVAGGITRVLGAITQVEDRQLHRFQHEFGTSITRKGVDQS